MLNIFRRKPKQENKRTYISHILVNDPDGELRLNVQDYTRNPAEFLVDINNFPLDKLSFMEAPIVKIEGTVASLKTRALSPEHSIEYTSLFYEGFITINKEFPLHFSAYRNNNEVSNLRLEELMLEAARTSPIIITGRLFRPSNSPCIPYELCPYVLQLGDYISPKPK